MTQLAAGAQVPVLDDQTVRDFARDGAVLLRGVNFVDVGFEMAVGGQDVEPSIQVVIEKEKTELQKFFARFAQTFLGRFVGEDKRVALGDVERVHLVCKISDGDAQRVVVAEARGVNAHCAARQTVGVVGDAGTRADFLERAVALVVKQKILHGVVRDDEINPAVVVHVHRFHGEGFRGRQSGGGIFYLDAGLRGNIGEMAMAVVVIKVWKSSSEISRRAISATNFR